MKFAIIAAWWLRFAEIKVFLFYFILFFLYFYLMKAQNLRILGVDPDLDPEHS
jgi:hypothetical protein